MVAEGLIDPAVHRSWLRSRQFGLAPTGRPAGAPHASAAQLGRALERQRELVAHARPVMDFLFEQTRDTGSMVILADAQGTLLHALGDASFVDRAQRIALRPGANWHERWRGTNAIGTALADEVSVVIHAGEHYLERNGFLTCAAVPIIDPRGRVLGALDISGDHRGLHRHTLALVRLAVRNIERRLFETRHAGNWRLRLHEQAEGVGSVGEGLLALSEDGWLVGANAAALAMLRLTRDDLGTKTLENLFQLELTALGGLARQSGDAPRALRRLDGSTVWSRIEASSSIAEARFPPVARREASSRAHADRLDELDHGDPGMQSAIARARRVMDKPIALLLQGESGVGKEVFARAMHASSARAGGPFVAVNCAAMPDQLIEAELFGYRAGAFTGAAREGASGRIRDADGGTLFLDEIGDMPLALQARLLRVLQDREVQPLGGGKAVAVDFRLVCATHRDLRVEVEHGRFREDLYYRINGMMLQLPALRERLDRAELTTAMLRAIEPDRELSFTPGLADCMAAYRWPGNLRQLNSVLRTACAMIDGREAQIDWPHLPDDVAQDLRAAGAQKGAVVPMDEASLREQAEHAIRTAVQDCEGNLSAAARRLGISRNTLYRKLRELGLQ